MNTSRQKQSDNAKEVSYTEEKIKVCPNLLLDSRKRRYETDLFLITTAHGF